MEAKPDTALKANTLYGIRLGLSNDMDDYGGHMRFCVSFTEDSTLQEALVEHQEFLGVNFGAYTHVLEVVDLGPDPKADSLPSKEDALEMLSKVSAMYEEAKTRPGVFDRLKEAFGITEDDTNLPVGTVLRANTAESASLTKVGAGKWALESGEVVELADEIVAYSGRDARFSLN